MANRAFDTRIAELVGADPGATADAITETLHGEGASVSRATVARRMRALRGSRAVSRAPTATNAKATTRQSDSGQNRPLLNSDDECEDDELPAETVIAGSRNPAELSSVIARANKLALQAEAKGDPASALAAMRVIVVASEAHRKATEENPDARDGVWVSRAEGEGAQRRMGELLERHAEAVKKEQATWPKCSGCGQPMTPGGTPQ